MTLAQVTAGGATYEIRRARGEDVGPIVELIAADQIGATRDGGDLAPYERAFATIDADPAQLLVVVTEAGGAIAGTLQLTFIPAWPGAAACARRSRRCACARTCAAAASVTSCSPGRSRRPAAAAARSSSSQATRAARMRNGSTAGSASSLPRGVQAPAHMSLPLPDDASEPRLAPEYAAAREREGRVMAILRAMGPRPEMVRAFLAMADAALYGPAALSRREREVIALATSEANGARYSAEIHRELLAGLGAPGPRDDALAAFARRLTTVPAEAPQAVDDLREHLSDTEVYDAIAVVGLLNLANRAALATGITPADDLP